MIVANRKVIWSSRPQSPPTRRRPYAVSAITIRYPPMIDIDSVWNTTCRDTWTRATHACRADSRSNGTVIASIAPRMLNRSDDMLPSRKRSVYRLRS